MEMAPIDAAGDFNNVKEDELVGDEDALAE
jgi:hypothetical protein